MDVKLSFARLDTVHGPRVATVGRSHEPGFYARLRRLKFTPVRGVATCAVNVNETSVVYKDAQMGVASHRSSQQPAR